MAGVAGNGGGAGETHVSRTAASSVIQTSSGQSLGALSSDTGTWRRALLSPLASRLSPLASAAVGDHGRAGPGADDGDVAVAVGAVDALAQVGELGHGGRGGVAVVVVGPDGRDGDASVDGGEEGRVLVGGSVMGDLQYLGGGHAGGQELSLCLDLDVAAQEDVEARPAGEHDDAGVVDRGAAVSFRHVGGAQRAENGERQRADGPDVADACRTCRPAGE